MGADDASAMSTSTGVHLAAGVEAARRLGLDPAGAAVTRVGQTTQVRLPTVAAVARVHAGPSASAATREVEVGRALAARSVPAARLVGTGDQPVHCGDLTVTVWQWLESTGQQARLVDLAHLARELHTSESGVPGAEVRFACDPVAATAEVLDGAEVAGADGGDIDLMRAVIERLGSWWTDEAHDDPLGAALIHGDLHRGNAVVTASGAHLVDLDLAGTGPRSYDLAAIEVATRRYGVPSTELEAAYRAYGADPRGWDGFGRFCEIYEAWVTAWALADSTQSRAAHGEASRRMQRWRDGDAPPWQLR